jgi:hypothetical protein
LEEFVTRKISLEKLKKAARLQGIAERVGGHENIRISPTKQLLITI